MAPNGHGTATVAPPALESPPDDGQVYRALIHQQEQLRWLVAREAERDALVASLDAEVGRLTEAVRVLEGARS